MSIYESTGQLDKAMKLLLGQWHEARALWHDAVSEKFEQEHLLPLQMDLKRAQTALDHAARAVKAVRDDCG